MKRTRSQAGMSLLEVLVASSILIGAFVMALRNFSITARALSSTNAGQAAGSVEDIMMNNLLAQITTFYRRVSGTKSWNCKAGMLPNTGTPAFLPAINTSTYLAQSIAAASTSLVNLAVLPNNYPQRSGTAGEVSRQNAAITRCFQQQTLNYSTFPTAPGFYFCAALSPPVGANAMLMPGDISASNAFGEFLYSVRNWNGDVAQHDPIYCKEVNLTETRVAILYYTLYWFNTTPGGPVYHQISGQMQTSDATATPY